MKTILKILSVLVIIFLVSSFSCKKDEQKSKTEMATGMVLFFGEPAVDGCGWVIKIDTVTYSPIELDSKFKIDSLKVKLNYEILNSRWHCGWREPGYFQIIIKTIINI